MSKYTQFTTIWKHRIQALRLFFLINSQWNTYDFPSSPKRPKENSQSANNQTNSKNGQENGRPFDPQKPSTIGKATRAAEWF